MPYYIKSLCPAGHFRAGQFHSPEGREWSDDAFRPWEIALLDGDARLKITPLAAPESAEEPAPEAPESAEEPAPEAPEAPESAEEPAPEVPETTEPPAPEESAPEAPETPPAPEVPAPAPASKQPKKAKGK